MAVLDTVIIGSGPAGLTAAIYTTREHIQTVMLEKGVIGGLAAVTDLIENYPGFAKGVAGLELAKQLREQAERFGAKIELAEVTSIEDKGETKTVKTLDNEYEAKTVLIATGTDYKKIGVPGEAEFYGRGVHYCATCDGALYNGKKLIVVGSGNSAAQEGLFLTRFASEINILIRGDRWKASDVLVDKIKESPKIKVHFNTTTEEILGENNRVTKVVGHDSKTNKAVEFDADGVFVFVGLKPNTEFLKDSAVELNEFGFVKTDMHLQTSIPGVFCAGDVRDGATMQIASAAGEGATAALHIREYIES